MRPLVDMDTIQIEITNHCQHQCSNCTRLVGHHKHPYFMELDAFRLAVDSMVGFPHMTGVMGGEPLLHPKFEEMCRYLANKIPREQCGLWTCFPSGYEHYRDVIVATFGNIFLNDHTRTDILHAPILVCPDELPLQKWQYDYYINHCWVQNSWSASINPRGAWFCEIAGALAMLRGSAAGWKVEPGWWQRSPQDFIGQIHLCNTCGAAMPLQRRESTQEVDDIGQWWLARLKSLHSPKVKAGKYMLHPLELCNDQRQTATYKDESYRDAIAKRYGMFLMVNDHGFQTPYLRKAFEYPQKRKR